RTRRSWTDLLDSLLLHPVLGIPLLALIVFGMFQLVFGVADPFMEWIEAGQEAIGSGIEAITSPGALRSFLIDGIVNGVGSVLVFLPQIALLIAMVSVLEASGYMARAAYLLDRVLGRFGLSGRSFVPLATSFGCAIPGVMATRIIDDERDRLATILVAPLMSCSARLPVYVVLIGAFFPPAWAGVVLFGLYLLGIVVAVVVATVVR
ncbi:MAG: ferrous iron transporter B, partial [Planctomycetes bacterium]|nr:ferrous iron transporter B [Planctomycetota bacterium]